MPQNFGIPLLLTLFAGLATAIGSIFAFIVKKDNLKVLSVGLGFSAGVMIFLSFTDIIPGAVEMLKAHFPLKYNWIVYLGFLLGILIAILIDYFIPDHIDETKFLHPEVISTDKRMQRAGLFTAVAICIHNFPEGMATFLTASHDLTLGISVALAIAIHNIPEGIAILKKVANMLQPSILAASSKSFGKAKKYCRIKNTPNPPNSPGKISA